MDSYVGFVMGLNFAVDLLLLAGTNRLHGNHDPVRTVIPGAAIGGFYAGICLLPIPAAVAGIPMRIAVLMVVGLTGYGFSHSGLQRSAAFSLIMLLIHIITAGFEATHLVITIAGIVCVAIIWLLASYRGLGTHLVNMELNFGGKTMHVMALNDTGNGLRDPITGEGVIVVSPQVAYEFTGLTKEQLRYPDRALSLLPGARLIPYQSVDKDNGLLLAVRFPNVKVGKNTASALVAFAPGGFQTDGSFQALTGRRI